MPLKAIIDGETIIGPDLSKDEWAELKIRHKKGLPVRMCCCGAPGHLRTIKGTQHFYHAADTGCPHDNESKEHLEIKYLIYRICQAEQWETSVEFPSADRTWISDVFAQKDGRKIVFEIQLSPIPSSDLLTRDKKYRDEGIESYWLLNNYLDRAKEFKSWYDSLVYPDDDRRKERIPYIDRSFFFTGTENHLFIAKNIRTVGLRAKKQTLYTTNNPEIPLAVWVREVLKGNYQKYLQESAAIFQRKHELRSQASPALLRLRDFYQKIIRDEIYQEKVRKYYRKIAGTEWLRDDSVVQQKFREISDETDWLKREYETIMSESYGLFSWKKLPGYSTSYPVFRLESEAKIKKLDECVRIFSQWEHAFDDALRKLDREITARGE
ncbi:competence protein CoiA family protein [Methanoregula sp.]|uniref:competence protein CoiA n=1 Tax=Methanoregula sp. TaxID=2052170 RepID=UPI002621C7FA|nr:competence protein CoiA family protein [Methanoregula sp.]MDD5142393.1 competence protein CoiA family protein [Methanoregula sp.]